MQVDRIPVITSGTYYSEDNSVGVLDLLALKWQEGREPSQEHLAWNKGKMQNLQVSLFIPVMKRCAPLHHDK